jgi:hypothetical protein
VEIGVPFRVPWSVVLGPETGTGTFNAANWAVWDASDLRDNFL